MHVRDDRAGDVGLRLPAARHDAHFVGHRGQGTDGELEERVVP